MRRALLLLCVTAIASCAHPAATVDADSALDVSFGADPAQRLDVYAPKGAVDAPVILFVHGGAWRFGDKAQIGAKLSFFLDEGYVVVSTNYRLTPAVQHPAHVQDVAAALAWIKDNIAAHGGDPTRIGIMGHSAGAHLVALVATDPQWLAAHGMALTDVRCTFADDTEGFDIPTSIAEGSASRVRMMTDAFGADPATWADASPLTHVAAEAGIGPFLLVERGAETRREILHGFADALFAADIDATIIDADGLSHLDVNRRVGEASDTVMTPPTRAFFAACLQ